MSMYVFAPAGSEAFHNNLLKYAVEFIGSQQKGFGSSWAKGKRYLKKEVLCSGTALKRACVIKNKYVNHDFEEYDAMKSNFDKVFSYNLDEVRKKNLVDMERLFNLLSVMNEQQIRLDTAVHGINSNGICLKIFPRIISFSISWKTMTLRWQSGARLWQKKRVCRSYTFTRRKSTYLKRKSMPMA